MKYGIINRRRLSRFLLFIWALLAVFLLSPHTLHAMSDVQRRLFRSGILYFDAEERRAICSTDNVDLIGNDNIEKIFNFFLSKGLSTEQAAGIAGNAMQESSGDPAASNNGNYLGIFQWSANDRWPGLVAWVEDQEELKQRGFGPDSLEGQLAFSWHEAGQRRNGPDKETNIEGMQRQDKVDLSTWYWGRFYEVAITGGNSTAPLTNVQHLDKRIEYAEEIIINYGGGTPGGGSQPFPSAYCAGGNGQDTQHIDGFTVYSQYDPAWRNLPYSTSTIGESGCGPAAMAMIITKLTGEQVTPVDTATYAGSIGMYVPGVGSSWDIGPRLASRWGLRSEPVERDVIAITNALRQGRLIIAPGQGPKPFTSGGHFIVIRGVTADGKFKVGDSGHSDTSEQDWDPQFIVDNMRNGGIYAIFDRPTTNL